MPPEGGKRRNVRADDNQIDLELRPLDDTGDEKHGPYQVVVGRVKQTDHVPQTQSGDYSP